MNLLTFQILTYFITKKDGSLWDSWENLINDLRDNFYGALKNKLVENELGVDKIILRRTSPFIIQIKKAKEGYYGLILLWIRWLTKGTNEKINKLKVQIFKLIESFRVKRRLNCE
jgi:hypothetical protein